MKPARTITVLSSEAERLEDGTIELRVRGRTGKPVALRYRSRTDAEAIGNALRRLGKLSREDDGAGLVTRLRDERRWMDEAIKVLEADGEDDDT